MGILKSDVWNVWDSDLGYMGDIQSEELRNGSHVLRPRFYADPKIRISEAVTKDANDVGSIVIAHFAVNLHGISCGRNI